MFDTPLSFFEKKTKGRAQNLYCYINRSQNQAGALFWSIDPQLEYNGSLVQSSFCGKSSGIQILECHSRKCGLHSPLCCLNWTDNPTAIYWEPVRARNRTGQNKDYKGVSHYIDLLAGSQTGTILAICGRALSWCKIHWCFNSDFSIRICRCNCCNTPW